MRKIDEDKSKATKTLNFDMSVLVRLEKVAKRQGTTVSNLVNALCRRYIMTDESFYSEMAKESYLEFQKMKYMAEQAKIMAETQQ